MTGDSNKATARDSGEVTYWTPRHHQMPTMRWPGIGKQLEEIVRRCPECCKNQTQPTEPLLPMSFPQLPWQRVGTDLFEWKKSQYLLIVDYYSRYIEISKLSGETATIVINYTKTIFSRHGIPQHVVSDSGPQFMSEATQPLQRNMDLSTKRVVHTITKQTEKQRGL